MLAPDQIEVPSIETRISAWFWTMLGSAVSIFGGRGETCGLRYHHDVVETCAEKTSNDLGGKGAFWGQLILLSKLEVA